MSLGDCRINNLSQPGKEVPLAHTRYTGKWSIIYESLIACRENGHRGLLESRTRGS